MPQHTREEFHTVSILIEELMVDLPCITKRLYCFAKRDACKSSLPAHLPEVGLIQIITYNFMALRDLNDIS